MDVDLKGRILRWRHKSKKIETRELRVALDKTSFARFERLRTRVLRVRAKIDSQNWRSDLG